MKKVDCIRDEDTEIFRALAVVTDYLKAAIAKIEPVNTRTALREYTALILADILCIYKGYGSETLKDLKERGTKNG